MSSRAFLDEYFNDAFEDTAKKRREVFDRGLLLIAHVIREELPTATAITVSHNDARLLAVHDAEGTIWKDGDETPRAEPSRPNRGYIRRTLRDMFNFARDPHPLLAAGWKPVRDEGDTYRAELPEDPDREQEKERGTVPAADDRPHGTPGEDAGNCAQCRRLLIWDRTGKRVNDDWGEYVCSGPRPGGTASAVHVLAAQETAQAQPATKN